MEGELPSYLIYRPLSFYVTPLFLRLGVPILSVTLTSGVLAALMLAIAIRGGAHAYLYVAAIGFTFHVLDCVDGNMARTVGRPSRFGGLVDGCIDMSFWSLLFVSVGLLVRHTGGGVLGQWALPFSMALPIMVLLNRQTRDNFTVMFEQATYFSSEIPLKLSLGDMAMIGFVGLEGTYVFAIVIGGAFGVLDKVLVGMGIYVGIIFIGALWMTFSKALGVERATSDSDPR
jgi:phosphatidylglycerophosphate synthase